MMDIPTVCTSARALTLDHEQVQEFAMTPFSITIRGVTVATISEGEETKLGAVQEMALLLQDGTEVPLIQGVWFRLATRSTVGSLRSGWLQFSTDLERE